MAHIISNKKRKKIIQQNKILTFHGYFTFYVILNKLKYLILIKVIFFLFLFTLCRVFTRENEPTTNRPRAKVVRGFPWSISWMMSRNFASFVSSSLNDIRKFNSCQVSRFVSSSTFIQSLPTPWKTFFITSQTSFNKQWRHLQMLPNFVIKKEMEINVYDFSRIKHTA